MKIYKMIRINTQGLILIMILMAVSFMLGLKINSTNSNERLIEVPYSIDAENLKLKAGLLPLEGEGIIIRMDDSHRESKKDEDKNLYVIHDSDLLKVINELRSAGAEAISINGQRLIDRSEIRCAGPTVSVNNVRSSAPFEIHAIGDQNILEGAIRMRGGVSDTLKVWGIQLEIEMSNKVYIPSYKGTYLINHSKIVNER